MYIHNRQKKTNFYMIAPKITGIIIDNTIIKIIVVDIILFTFLLLKFIVFTSFIIIFRKDVLIMLFIIAGLLLFFYLWMRFGNAKANRKIQEEKNAFWEKENVSNTTRKVDISGLDYLVIPIDCLPFTETTDEVLISLQNSITALSQRPILNLTGLSNTDLKLKYGVANITLLSEYDSNYTLLVNSLYQWGSYLYEHEKIPEATTVLEFGVQCKTDVSKHYLLLATIYKDANKPEKIDNLILVANSLQTLMKDSILSALKEIKLSTYLA